MRLVCEAEQLEQVVCAPGGFAPAETVIAGVIDEHLDVGQEAIQVHLLLGEAHQCTRGARVVRVTEDPDLTRCRAQQVAGRRDEWICLRRWAPTIRRTRRRGIYLRVSLLMFRSLQVDNSINLSPNQFLACRQNRTPRLLVCLGLRLLDGCGDSGISSVQPHHTVCSMLAGHLDNPLISNPLGIEDIERMAVHATPPEAGPVPSEFKPRDERWLLFRWV